MVDTISYEYDSAGKNTLFLEHYVDDSVGNRLDRWWDAYDGGPGLGVPLIIVDSGFRMSYGWEDFRDKYTSMVDDALTRPAGAEIYAGYGRSGNTVYITANITNWSGVPLGLDNYATVNALVYERSRVIHTGRFVRAATSQAITANLWHGHTATFYLTVENVPVEEWRMASVLVLLDYRPDPASTTFDMLQATIASHGAPPTRVPDPTATQRPTSRPTATLSVTVTPGPSPTPRPILPAYVPFCSPGV